MRDENCREFVASEASDHDPLVCETSQTRRDFFENLVAAVMPQRVVDLLEVIEIDECNCKCRTVCRRLIRELRRI